MAPSLPSLRAVVAISLATLFTSSLVSAHTVITYPGWRGDNLHTNGSVVDSQGLGVGDNNTYPYGMQWMYPCNSPPPHLPSSHLPPSSPISTFPPPDSHPTPH